MNVSGKLNRLNITCTTTQERMKLLHPVVSSSHYVIMVTGNMKAWHWLLMYDSCKVRRGVHIFTFKIFSNGRKYLLLFKCLITVIGLQTTSPYLNQSYTVATFEFYSGPRRVNQKSNTIHAIKSASNDNRHTVIEAHHIQALSLASGYAGLLSNKQ